MDHAERLNTSHHSFHVKHTQTHTHTHTHKPKQLYFKGKVWDRDPHEWYRVSLLHLSKLDNSKQESKKQAQYTVSTDFRDGEMKATERRSQKTPGRKAPGPSEHLPRE